MNIMPDTALILLAEDRDDDVVLMQAPAQGSSVRPLQNQRSWTSWITWRLGFYVAAVGALVAAGFMVLGWFATSSYYLADRDGTIYVYQGQPHGFLWYQPKPVLNTSFPSSELRPSDAKALQRLIVEPTLAAAITHAANMHTAWTLIQPVAVK